MTLIDAAHAAMSDDPENEGLRLAFYARAAESELFLLLEREAAGGAAEPKVFPLDTGPTVLAFDSEERLAEFAGSAPYLALPGRKLAAMLAGNDLALGLNLGVTPSAFLMPPEAVAWLVETASASPIQEMAKIAEVAPPLGLPEDLVTAIDAKLARAAGLASLAYLSAVTYENGASSHILAVVDATEGAEAPLAAEISEALRFSGLEAAALDVLFIKSSDQVAARLAKVGLRFDLPEPETPSPIAAPGVDPDRPPKLR